MSKFVFLSAADAAIVLRVDDVVRGTASTAEELAELLTASGVDIEKDTVACSSSIDFASEEGFATDGAAHEIIDEALEQL